MIKTILNFFLNFMLGHWWYILDLKRKADVEIFKKFNAILPHEIYQYFVDDTYNMQYSAGYLNQHLDKYNQMAEDPTNHYNNKEINLKHIKFAKALRDLLMLVSINFGFPNGQHEIMNLKSVASHETERYKSVFNEVRILNDDLCSCYDDYIKLVKKRLFI